MPRSTLTFTNAQNRVAEAIGAASSADELTRAGYAIQQAFELWNNSHNWNFLYKQHTGYAVVAPFDVTAVTNGTTTVTSATAFGSVEVGDEISASADIYPGTYVTVKTSSSNITISRAARSSNATATLTFTRPLFALPTDFKSLYNARMLEDPRILFPIDTRLYDRSVQSQVVGWPTHYIIIPSMQYLTLTTQFPDGAIRLVPTPSTADTLLLKYYRRMGVPSNGADVLDIPQDYEFSIISLAKALFLIDKGDKEKGMFYWNLGQSELARAKASESRQPDEDAGLIPSVGVNFASNPNSVIPYLGDW